MEDILVGATRACRAFLAGDLEGAAKRDAQALSRPHRNVKPRCRKRRINWSIFRDLEAVRSERGSAKTRVETEPDAQHSQQISRGPLFRPSLTATRSTSPPARGPVSLTRCGRGYPRSGASPP